MNTASPLEFFRRTFLTESLKQMLVNGVKRLSGIGRRPVIQLQRFRRWQNALHACALPSFSGLAPGELPGVDNVLASRVKSLPKAKPCRAGWQQDSPAIPVKKPDGTVIRTLWGEMAYQLGGKKAFARVKADDEKPQPATCCASCSRNTGLALIIIDEWVAYARAAARPPK